MEKSIVLDETSVNGLFNHFVSSDSVPILCIDEAYSFLWKISSSSKLAVQVNLTMERLCKCFDGEGEQGQANRRFLGKGLVNRLHNPEAVPGESLAQNFGGSKWASRVYSVFSNRRGSKET